MSDTALVITVSTRAAAGVYADRSGPVVVEALRRAGLRGRAARWWCRTAIRSATALREAVADGTRW